MQGTATARRGKRNTQRSSASQTELSQPSASSRSERGAKNGSIRSRARASSIGEVALPARRLSIMSDLAFAGLARQAQLVRDGEVTSRELVELSLSGSSASIPS